MTKQWALGLAVVTLATMFGDGRAVAGLIVDVTVSADSRSLSTFGTLDLTTGKYSAIANLGVTVAALTSGSNGALYAAATDGFLYTIGSDGVASRLGTVSAPVSAGMSQQGYLGLASAGASGFFAANGNLPGTLDRISTTNTSIAALGTLPNIIGSGALSYGPNGSLYLVGADSSGTTALFVVNTTTGVETEIGSGLRTFSDDALTLVTAGGQLYGIDTAETFGSGPIDIYTINTTTGVATATGVTVTGLAVGYTLDTAAAIGAGTVPEPPSLALCGISGAIGLAIAGARRKRT